MSITGAHGWKRGVLALGLTAPACAEDNAISETNATSTTSETVGTPGSGGGPTSSSGHDHAASTGSSSSGSTGFASSTGALVPTISEVSPLSVCSDQGFTITVTGSGFAADASVLVGVNAADHVSINGPGDTIEATFDAGIPAGVYDVTVDNGRRSDTLVAALTVDRSPVPFLAHVPTLHGSVPMPLTVFVDGLQAAPTGIDLIDGNAVSTPLSFSQGPEGLHHQDAVVPESLAAGDSWVEVTAANGCTGSVAGPTIMDTLGLAIEGISPAAAPPGDLVTVNLTSPPALAAPRVYLFPATPQANDVAIPLEGVTMTGDSLSGRVPEGTPVNDYDVLVVDTAGSGTTLDAFAVAAAAAPVIDAAVPWMVQEVASVTLTGSGFDDSGGLSVAVECLLPDDTSTSMPAVLKTITSTSVEIFIDAAFLPNHSVCEAIITNPDGTEARYQNLLKIAASGTPAAPAAASSLGTARRAPQVAIGSAPTLGRSLYVTGGDAGSPASAMSSIEVARLDRFGNAGPFSTLPSGLPAARTLGGLAAIGRFLYLVGGHDGSSAVATVHRAHILDPVDAPAGLDFDAQAGGVGQGLDAGVWHYRVSATFPGTDPSNPNGESLPSRPLAVELAGASSTVEVTLSWSAVAGANGYRIYRSPTANAGPDQVELVGTTNGGASTTFIDADAIPTGEMPLAPGALGTWHAVASLTTPREGAAVIATPVPASSTEWILYAFAGRDTTATVLDTYEWTKVTITGNGEQNVDAWTLGVNACAARAEAMAWAVTPLHSPDVSAGESFVYVGGGRSGVSDVTSVLGGTLQSGGSGELGTFAAGQLFASRAGAAAAVGSDLVIAFGGASGGTPVSSGLAAEVLAGPDLGNWAVLGASLPQARNLPGSASHTAVWFVAGGENGGTPTTDVHRLVF